MLINTVIEAIVQLIIFSAIPLIYWFFTARKKEKFFVWIGLKTPIFSNKKRALLIFFLAFIFLLASGMLLIFIFEDKSMLANAKFFKLGFNGVIPALVYAIVQTGLTEEILFRGFLNKRIASKFGFIVGNNIQAVLFGLLHGVLFLGQINILMVIITTIFTTIVGWLMGYLNEKLGNGSIIPSWAIHSLMNIISSLIFLCGLVTV